MSAEVLPWRTAGGWLSPLHPGPFYQRRHRPLRHTHGDQLQPVLTGGPERERKGLVSVTAARGRGWGGHLRNNIQEFFWQRGLHLVFKVCLFLALSRRRNPLPLYFLSVFLLLDEKRRGLDPRPSPERGLTGRHPLPSCLSNCILGDLPAFWRGQRMCWRKGWTVLPAPYSCRLSQDMQWKNWPKEQGGWGGGTPAPPSQPDVYQPGLVSVRH